MAEEHKCWTDGNITTVQPVVVSPFVSATQITTLSLNSLLIIPGNIINILVLSKLQNITRTTRLLLVCLAVVDLSTGIVNAIFSLPSAITQRWIFGDFLCKCIGLAYPITCDSSLVFITLITIDRFVAITKPLHYNRIMTMKRVLSFMVFFSVVISCCLYILCSVNDPFDNIRFMPDTAACMIYFAHPCVSTKTIICFCFFVLLPFSIIFVLYVHILRIAYRAAREVQNLNPTRGDQKARVKTFSRQEWKATKTTLVVTGAFSSAWLPLLISTIYSAAVGVQRLEPGVEFFVVILPTMNSWWNFFIYSVMNRQFREAFWNNFVKKLIGTN